MVTIKIDLRDIKSIKQAEIKKENLEKAGYEVIAEDVGFLSATLFMKKI
jgi:hypothetical protein